MSRRWAPVHLVPPGSVIELSEEDLTEIVIAEHKRWLRRRLAAGETGENVVPWEELPPRVRNNAFTHLCSQLLQLEDVGFVPAVPAGGPDWYDPVHWAGRAPRRRHRRSTRSPV